MRITPPDRRTLLQWLLATGLPLPAALPAAAQDPGYPSKPIRLVPFGTAGGPIDIIARLYAERLQQRWGQPFVIEVKPGASGIVAADFVAKAPPDGYTLMLTLSLTHTSVPLLQQKVPYDPVRDFQPLTQVATGGPMLVVPLANPATNLKEFVAWAKAKKHVSYGTWANPATARNQASKMRALGITGMRRVGALPQVRTFAEQGFDGFTLDSWVGFLAPARLPRAVLDKLVAGLRETTQLPEVRAKLLDMGFEPLGNTPEEFAAAQRAEVPQWAALIKTTGVTIE